jgi:hypothetical protein
MKKFAILAFLSSALVLSAEGLIRSQSNFPGSDPTPAAKTFRTIKNEAFKPGEKLTFRLHYGLISAGEGVLEVMSDKKTFGGRPCYQVVGTGKTVGAFDWFFKVRDTYESTIDSQSLIPWYFARRVDEGGYKISQNVTFNHYKDSAISEKKTIYIPENTQDIVSALYYARNLDFSNAKEGQVFEIQGYIDDELFPLNIKYVGKETVDSKKGTFNCLKFKPMLQKGRVFKESADMTIWISDDKNHLPIRVQSDIFVGSIKMDLVDFQNLANAPAIVKD